MNLRIGPLWIHPRLEQWDLNCWPIVIASIGSSQTARAGSSAHWRWGIQVRPFRLSRAGCGWAYAARCGGRNARSNLA